MLLRHQNACLSPMDRDKCNGSRDMPRIPVPFPKVLAPRPFLPSHCSCKRRVSTKQIVKRKAWVTTGEKLPVLPVCREEGTLRITYKCHTEQVRTRRIVEVMYACHIETGMRRQKAEPKGNVKRT